MGRCFFVEGQVHGSEVGFQLSTVLLLLQDLLLGLLPNLGLLIFQLLLRGSRFIFSIFVLFLFFVVKLLLLLSADRLWVTIVVKELNCLWFCFLQRPALVTFNSRGQSKEKLTVVSSVRKVKPCRVFWKFCFANFLMQTNYHVRVKFKAFFCDLLDHLIKHLVFYNRKPIPLLFKEAVNRGILYKDRHKVAFRPECTAIPILLFCTSSYIPIFQVDSYLVAIFQLLIYARSEIYCKVRLT